MSQNSKKLVFRRKKSRFFDKRMVENVKISFFIKETVIMAIFT